MQWIFVYWILISSTMILASIYEGSRHKRTLSHLTKLFSNDEDRSQEKCTKSYRKSSRAYEMFLFPGQREIVVETIPEIRRTNNKVMNDNALIYSLGRFFPGDTFEATSRAVGEVVTNILTGHVSDKTNDVIKVQRQNQHISGHKLKIDHKSTLKTIPENVITIDKIVYDRPQIHRMPSVVRLGNPIIGMPRKYSYEQIRGNMIQKFSLDKNSDVIVTESKKQPPRPAYVDDRIKDVILGVSPLARQLDSHLPKDEYNQSSLKTNLYNYERDKISANMLPSNQISMYAGDPIIVIADTPKNTKTSVSAQGIENDRTIQSNNRERERGDIPEF